MATLNSYFSRVLVIEERLKARLRAQIAAALVPLEIIEDPAGVGDALIGEVLAQAFAAYKEIEVVAIGFARSIAEGPVRFNDGAATEAQLVELRAVLEAEFTKFAIALEFAVGRMVRQGMTQPAILESLGRQTEARRQTPLFSALINGIALHAGAGVQAVGNTAILAALAATEGQPNPDDEEWVWLTVHDTRVCDDCAPRHGKIRTLTEWERLGMPKAGWSVCNDNCRCLIMPAEFVDDEIDLRQPVKISRQLAADIGPRAAELAEVID